MRTEEDALAALSKRVQQVEGDVSSLRSEVTAFKEDMTVLRTQIRQIDERTLRGERLMMEMQIEQRHMARVLDAVAAKLEIPPVLAPTPIPFAVPSGGVPEAED